MKNTIKFWGVAACLSLLAACNTDTSSLTNIVSGGSTATNTTTTGGTTAGGALTVYFTQPDASSATTLTGGPETALISAINAATISVDVAIYELSLTNLTQSLIDANNRGLRVRVLTDTDNIDWEQVKRLINAGIAVKGDQRSALMHNKFTVIDNQQVWTGSMNYTYNGAYHHDENLLQLNSVAAALNYTEEFSQLWVGIHRKTNTADSVFNESGTSIQVYFSPDDNFRSAHLLPLLESAQQSVHFMAYSFTSSDITNTLGNLKNNGIEIKGVLDTSQSGQSSAQYDDLKAKGIDVLLDKNPYKLHHKVMIIDNRYVVTGSYNFSQNADNNNDENSLIIDNTSLATSYEAEFSRVYSKASE